ncbi:MAG: hypothetical protein K0S01_2454 [Herbinix sp.]|jgi:glycosyltransferase involved in cell wall biosynthesis|nr:hypothetical protein [Herbinix sp.]
MQHKISVLIPAYQSENYLCRCLESILIQTYPNVEIVIVDDGSTDRTLDIIREYACCYSNIHYKSVKKSGVSIVRNILIAESTGDYLFFLDSDDFIAKNALQVLYQVSKEHEADIVQCEMEFTSEDTLFDMTDKGRIIYTKEEALRAYNRTSEGPKCMMIAKLCKRNVFNGITFPNNVQTQEDEYVAFLLINNCTTFVTVRQKLYAYYNNPGSIMRRSFDLFQYEVLPAVQNSIVFYQEHNMPEQVSRISFRYLTLLRFLYTETSKSFPEEIQRMQKLLDEYEKTLPFVLENLKLPDKVKQEFQNWGAEPLSVESHNYWEYVVEEVLPK